MNSSQSSLFGLAPSTSTHEASTAASNDAVGPIHEDELPKWPQPTNPIYLSCKDAPIRGTYVVDPSLPFNPLTQQFIVDQRLKAGKQHFQAIADGGAIDVDVWLASASGRGRRRAEERKVSIYLQIRNSKGDLLASVHRPMSRLPRFHLQAKLKSANGVIVIRLPRSFQGLVQITGTLNQVDFSEALNSNTTPLGTNDHLMRWYVGDIPEDDVDFQGDEVEIKAQHTSIVLQYVDADPGPGDSSLVERSMDHFMDLNWLDEKACHTDLAIACFRRIGRGYQEDKWVHSLTSSNIRTLPVDLRYACSHWASHLSRSSSSDSDLYSSLRAFPRHINYWLQVMSFLGYREKVHSCLQLVKAWLTGGSIHKDNHSSVLRMKNDNKSFLATLSDAIDRILQYYASSRTEQHSQALYDVESLFGQSAQPPPPSHRTSFPGVVTASGSMSNNNTEFVPEAQLPSTPKPATFLFFNRRDTSVTGTFVIKPSLRANPLLQRLVVGAASADGTRDFEAIVDGGSIDVAIWLVANGSIASHEGQVSEETKASIHLETQNSKDNLVAKVHRPMSAIPRFHLRAKSSCSNGKIVIHLPRSFQGLVKVAGTHNRMYFSDVLHEQTTLSCYTDNAMLYFVSEIPKEGMFQGDQIDIYAHHASIFMQYVDADLGVLSLNEEPFVPLLLEHLGNCIVNPYFIATQGGHQGKSAIACFRLIERVMQQERWLQFSASNKNKNVHLDLLYACSHWASHLSRSSHDEPAVNAAVGAFFSHHVLYWLKAMSLLGYSKEIKPCLDLAKRWVRTSPRDVIGYSAALADVDRFITTFYDVIERHSPQIYACLVFTPTTCMLRQSWVCKGQRRSIEVIGGLKDDWGMLRTLKGHTDSVTSVAFSPDSIRIASGSRDGAVYIWLATTGTLLQQLEGHVVRVNSIAFSLDGMRIAAGSDDSTVCIWDSTTAVLSLRILATTMKGHQSSVSSVSFSPDGMRIASGSDAGAVLVWDVVTGALVQRLDGHDDHVNVVTFSLDSMRLAFGSADTTMVVGTRLKSPEGRHRSIRTNASSSDGTCIAFSPNGARIASGSYDGTVRIWNATTGTWLKSLKGHQGTVYSVAFSANSMRIVSGSQRTVCIWDVEMGTLLKKSGASYSKVVAISPDGTRAISGTNIYDVTTGAILRTDVFGRLSIRSVAFSSDGTFIVSGSDDRVVRLWDAATGTPLSEDQRTTSGFPMATTPIFPMATTPISVTNTSTSSMLEIFDIPYQLSTQYQLKGEWIVEGDKLICWVPEQFRGRIQVLRNAAMLEVRSISTDGRIVSFRTESGL